MAAGVQVVVSKTDMKIKVPRKNHRGSVSAGPNCSNVYFILSQPDVYAIFAKLK